MARPRHVWGLGSGAESPSPGTQSAAGKAAAPSPVTQHAFNRPLSPSGLPTPLHAPERAAGLARAPGCPAPRRRTLRRRRRRRQEECAGGAPLRRVPASAAHRPLSDPAEASESGTGEGARPSGGPPGAAWRPLSQGARGPGGGLGGALVALDAARGRPRSDGCRAWRACRAGGSACRPVRGPCASPPHLSLSACILGRPAFRRWIRPATEVWWQQRPKGKENPRKAAPSTGAVSDPCRRRREGLRSFAARQFPSRPRTTGTGRGREPPQDASGEMAKSTARPTTLPTGSEQAHGGGLRPLVGRHPWDRDVRQNLPKAAFRDRVGLSACALPGP
nr:translation initiation factor IF-2-like [Equus asinus]